MWRNCQRVPSVADCNDQDQLSWNCQWRCQKQNVTAFVFRMNWRSDLLRISHKTLLAMEMLRCLRLWSLSNLLRISSVLRETSTLRCCPQWLYRVAFCGASTTYPVKCEQHWPRVKTSRSHTSNIVLARLAERVWYTKFQFTILSTYFLLSGFQVSLLLIRLI